jgi:hypothetical protein
MTKLCIAFRLGSLAVAIEGAHDEPEPPPSYDLDVLADEPTGIKPTLAKTQPVEQRRKVASR